MAKKSNDSAAQPRDARTPAKKSGASSSETRRQSTESSAAESSSTLENQPTHEEIATRAYFRHLSRQGQPGDPVADWFEAERELKTNGHKSA